MSIYNPDMWIMKITPGGSGNTKMYFENLFIKEGSKCLIGYTKEEGEIEKFSARWHKMKIGDLIVVIEGYNRVYGVVEIISEPFDDENGEGDKQADWFYHRRKAELVKWFDPAFEAKANTNRDTIIEYSGDGAIEICDEVWDRIKNEYINQKKSKQMQQRINILKYKKQIILQGPPGTGKTRMAKEIAEEVIFGNVSGDIKLQEQRLSETKKFKIIQFHPSYSYEDFVRGISTKVHEGSVFYETQDKLLLEFISTNEIVNNYQQYLSDYVDFLRTKIGVLPIDAELNLNLNGNGVANITELDEFNEEVINDNGGIWYGNGNSRLWFNQILILINWFHDFGNFTIQEFVAWLNQNHNNLGIAAHVDDNASAYFVFLRKFNSYIQKCKRYVLVVDEINRANLSAVLGELIYGLEYRNSKIASPYSINGCSEFNIPDNLFIIGTMNTADRSVGHIDYAIRRRFAFVDVLPSLEPIREAGREFFKEVAALFLENTNELENLRSANLKRSKYMATDFTPEEVMIGHSYFITNENDENGLSEEQQIKIKMKYEVLPILKEYIKDGILIESEELNAKLKRLADQVA